jgi:hypothetical protein
MAEVPVVPQGHDRSPMRLAGAPGKSAECASPIVLGAMSRAVSLMVSGSGVAALAPAQALCPRHERKGHHSCRFAGGSSTPRWPSRVRSGPAARRTHGRRRCRSVSRPDRRSSLACRNRRGANWTVIALYWSASGFIASLASTCRSIEPDAHKPSARDRRQRRTTATHLANPLSREVAGG